MVRQCKVLSFCTYVKTVRLRDIGDAKFMNICVEAVKLETVCCIIGFSRLIFYDDYLHGFVIFVILYLQ